jgi:cyclopropane fatty-acyl-phospholipid synthase-like methyltransferase
MLAIGDIVMTEPTAAYAGRVKYDDKRSSAYQHRKPHKHRAEMRLIDRAFKRIPKDHRVLDIPCGGGRVMLHLARKGYEAGGADLSESMVAIARESMSQARLSCAVEHQDIEKLTYADGQFDTIVCFRLFHHFPNVEIRQRVVSELCRVAGEFVVLSYFSPYSVQSVRRKLSGKDPDRFTTSLAEVEAYFRHAGFRLVEDFAQMRLLHTLHLAVFKRERSACRSEVHSRSESKSLP